MRDVLRSTARKFKIYMADSTAPTAAKTGLTSFTVYLTKDNGAENTVSPTIVERGHGWYEVTPLTAHRDTLGENAWTFTAPGAVDFPYKETVVLYDAQLAAVGANTTAPDNAGIASAKTAAESADTKLTAGRLSRIDRLPDVNAGAAGGLSLVGSEMSLTSAVLSALFADADMTALVNAIITRVESDLDGADVSVAAIATAVRDAILNRVLAGNHDTAGTTGKLLQTIQADAAAVKTVTTKLDTGLVLDGAVWQWTGNALELAPAGGGGGGSMTAEQAAALSRIDTATQSLRGSGLSPVANVGDGGRVFLTLGDDHETVIGNDVQIRVSDATQATYNLLTAAGASLSWAAGQGVDGNLITGTVGTPTHAGGITTIPVQVPNCAATGNTLSPYTWQLARTISSRRHTVLQGTLTLRQDMLS